MSITLTPEQIKERYGENFLNSFSSPQTSQTAQAPQPAQQSRFQETVQDVKQMGSNIKSRFVGGTEKFNEINALQKSGEQGAISSAFQKVGVGAGAISQSIGDLFAGVIKGVLSQDQEQAVKTKVATVAANVLQNPAVSSTVKQYVKAYQESTPEVKRNLEGVFNLAMLGADMAGIGLGSKVGKQIAEQGLKTAGRTAVGALDRIGEGLKYAGAATEKTGKKIVSTLYTPTAPQAKQIINYQARSTMLQRLGWAARDIEKAPITLADTIIKYNLSGLARGNIGARAKRIATNLFENQVKPVITSIRDKVSKTTIFNAMKKDILKVEDISRRKGLLDAFDALAYDYKHVSNWSYATLDKIKSDMSKRLPAKIWKEQDIAGDLNNVRVLFAAQARKTIREKLPKEILDIYNDYGSLIEIVARGEKALQRGFDAGILGITSEAIRVIATPVTSFGGKAVSEIGGAIKKVGQSLQKANSLK